MIRALRRWLRLGLGRVGGWLLGSRGTRASEALAAAPARILVIRIDERVGNVLLTTPLLLELRERFPAAQVDLLVAESKRVLVEGLARLIGFRKRDFFTRPLAFARFLLQLRRARYPVAIDASHWHHFSLSSALLLAWTGAPVRVAHARGQAALYATHLVTPPAAEEERGEVGVKLRLLRPLGIEAAPRPPLTLAGSDPAAGAPIASWLAEAGLAGATLVGLAPGSRKLDHRAPPALFARLARDVRAGAAVPIVLWGPGEEALARQVAREGEAILAPPTGLAALAALLRRLAAVVTNDTGPMHLAVACGTPTVALFVGSDVHRWGHAFGPHAAIPADGRPADEVLHDARRALLAILQGLAE